MQEDWTRRMTSESTLPHLKTLSSCPVFLHRTFPTSQKKNSASPLSKAHVPPNLLQKQISLPGPSASHPGTARHHIPHLALQPCWPLPLLCFSCPHCHSDRGHSRHTTDLSCLSSILHTDGSETCKYWRPPPIFGFYLSDRKLGLQMGVVRAWGGVGGQGDTSIRRPVSGKGWPQGKM